MLGHKAQHGAQDPVKQSYCYGMGSCWASSSVKPTLSPANIPYGTFETVQAGSKWAHRTLDMQITTNTSNF